MENEEESNIKNFQVTKSAEIILFSCGEA